MRLCVSHLWTRIHIGAFILNVMTDTLLFLSLPDKHGSTNGNQKNTSDHVFLLYSTSFVSLLAPSDSFANAWLIFLLVTIQIFSLYKMDYLMTIVTALGMLIPLHDHTLLFIVMCWSLFIHRWIFLADYENKQKILISCGLLIIFSIYAYVNSKLTMTHIWIRPPRMLYYHLFFILHRLNRPVYDLEHTLFVVIVGANIWKAEEKNVQKKNLVKSFKDFYAQLTVQTILSSLLDSFLIFLPAIIVYNLYEGPSMKSTFISFPYGLYMILLEGWLIAYNIADESCGKKKKVSVYLIWLFINIAVVLFYHYFLSTRSIYVINFHRIFPHVVTVIDLMWPFVLMVVKFISIPTSTTTDMMIKSN